MIWYDDLTPENKKKIEDWFCISIGCKKQKISDKKFLEILKTCWKNRIDMNFDCSPDYEDLEIIRGTEFKYHVLYALGYDYFTNEKLTSDLRELFK